jgi:hypothetical protein
MFYYFHSVIIRCFNAAIHRRAREILMLLLHQPAGLLQGQKNLLRYFCLPADLPRGWARFRHLVLCPLDNQITRINHLKVQFVPHSKHASSRL